MEAVDCVVVGAGVVGLAIARRLALAGREVIVLEAADAIGTQTSARNSEVVHAGIYYPSDWLKTRLCVAGRRELYRYLEGHGVQHRRTGKLIVATAEDEVAGLKRILEGALANGVEGLELLDGAGARSLEPVVRCVAAIHSPETGIVDSHGLMLALRGDAEAAGAMIAFRSPLVRGRVADGGVAIEVGGESGTSLACRVLVNSAGLEAPRVAASLDGLPAAAIPRQSLAKGNYFVLAGRAPFGRHVYPVPVAGGLGHHATVDLAGRVKFGPDVEWVGAIDYAVSPARAPAFYAAVRRYWPALPDGALEPGFAGVRPKLSGPGEPGRDFLIQGPVDHGVAGLVNLFGIESPGLTAALAIADHVAFVLGAQETRRPSV